MGRHWIGSDMVKCVGEVYSGRVLQIYTGNGTQIIKCGEAS